jgi:hypothetical protein
VGNLVRPGVYFVSLATYALFFFLIIGLQLPFFFLFKAKAALKAQLKAQPLAQAFFEYLLGAFQGK